jgi:alkylated DNA repair dioxygenase AlkB
VHRQLDLLSTGAPRFDASFAAARRIELAGGAWVDHVPEWVAGHDALFDALFDALERGLAWRTEHRWIYAREVVVPRWIASLARAGPGQPLIEELRVALSQRYGEAFVRTTAALYRDGRDSVAWHGDTVARDLPRAVVATVSLGARRRFLLRPAEGGPSTAFALGGGDLLVMGGSCQRTWRHAVPKVAAAGPRIALMFRPAWADEHAA